MKMCVCVCVSGKATQSYSFPAHTLCLATRRMRNVIADPPDRQSFRGAVFIFFFWCIDFTQLYVRFVCAHAPILGRSNNNNNNTFCIIHIIFAYALRFFSGRETHMFFLVTYLTHVIFLICSPFLGCLQYTFFVEINKKKPICKGNFFYVVFINQTSSAT